MDDSAVGAATSQAVRVRLLGPPVVVWDGGEQPLGPDRRHQLLGYLAYRADWVERSRLGALLWGDLPEDAAARNLRQALQRVRRLPWVQGLEEEGRRLRWLVATDLAEARSALAAGREPVAPVGPLLDGLEGYESGSFSDWLTFEREELWRELRGRLIAMSEDASALGDAARAVRLLDAVLVADPFDDDALVARLQVGLAHRPEAALEAFKAYERRLWRELGMRPSAQARELASLLEGARRPGVGARGGSTTALAERPAPAAGVAPAPVGEFVGRERQLEALLAYLRGGDRAVTVAGPSGIGKTRMVAEMLVRRATELAAAFPQGVAFVSLLEVVEARDVISVVARAVGASPTSVPRALAPQLDGRRLLVLDNVEHIPGAAAVIGELVSLTPGLTVLATSHTRLGLQGERLLRLEGLDAEESFALFVARAHRVEPGFAPDEDGLAAIGRACELVGHTPLGVELAASVAGSVPLDEVVRWLEGGAGAAGRPDATSRHGSLAAAFAYTFDLLPEHGQQALARLSVCAESFSAALATAVAEANLATLADLVDRALLLRRGERYTLHPLVRRLASERLAAAPGAVDAVLERLTAFMLALAEDVDAGRRRRRLDEELDHAAAALTWAERAGRVEAGLRLAGLLTRSWVARGRLHEGAGHIERLLATGEGAGVDPRVRLRAENALGNLYLYVPDLDRAEELLRGALPAALEAGTPELIGRVKASLASLALRRGAWDHAVALLSEALELLRDGRDPLLLVSALNNLAAIEIERGNAGAAVPYLQAAVSEVSRLADDQLQALVSYNLGWATYLSGDEEGGVRALYAATEVVRASGDDAMVANCLATLALVAFETGDLEAALLHTDASRVARLELGDRLGLVYTLELYAGLAALASRVSEAVTLSAAASAWRQRFGTPLPPAWRRPVEAVRLAAAQLPEAQLEHLRAAGRALTLEGAVALAERTLAANAA